MPPSQSQPGEQRARDTMSNQPEYREHYGRAASARPAGSPTTRRLRDVVPFEGETKVSWDGVTPSTPFRDLTKSGIAKIPKDIRDFATRQVSKVKKLPDKKKILGGLALMTAVGVTLLQLYSNENEPSSGGNKRKTKTKNKIKRKRKTKVKRKLRR